MLNFDSKRSFSCSHFLRPGILPESVFPFSSFAFSENLNSNTRPSCSQTIKALQTAYHNKIGAHRHRVAFSRKAKNEDYRPIRYFSTLLAASAFIQKQIFRTLLIDLCVIVPAVPAESPLFSDSKTNLKKAAPHETPLIDRFYSKKRRIVREESHQTALYGCRDSWISRQHRDPIHRINKWSNRFFRMAATAIERETKPYSVCRQCGSNRAEIPGIPRPICHRAIDHCKKPRGTPCSKKPGLDACGATAPRESPPKEPS